MTTIAPGGPPMIMLGSFSSKSVGVRSAFAAPMRITWSGAIGS